MAEGKQTVRRILRPPYIMAALVAFGVNFVWEVAQAGLFVGFEGLPWWRHVARCAPAAVGDLALAAVAYAAVALAVRRWDWPHSRRWVRPALLWAAVGLAFTFAVEHWSLAQGRWRYAPEMPQVLGIGLSPLLQWLFLPWVTLVVLRLPVRRRKETRSGA